MAKTDLTSVLFTSVWLTPPSPSNEFLEIIIALNIVLQTLHTIYREVRHVCFQFCLDDIIRFRDGRICQIVQGILQILCYIRFTMIFCITFFQQPTLFYLLFWCRDESSKIHWEYSKPLDTQIAELICSEGIILNRNIIFYLIERWHVVKRSILE